MKEITINEFESEVLESDIPVLVDFSAQWCGPCKLLAPILEKISLEAAEEIKVVKVDVDREPDLTMAFGIESIPAVLAFKGGEQVGASIGLTTEEKLLSLFE